MAEAPVPDVEQRAYELWELARVYLGDVLEVPAELKMLRQLIAEQLLEVGILRQRVDELEHEVGRFKEKR